MYSLKINLGVKCSFLKAKPAYFELLFFRRFWALKPCIGCAGFCINTYRPQGLLLAGIFLKEPPS